MQPQLARRVYWLLVHCRENSSPMGPPKPRRVGSQYRTGEGNSVLWDTSTSSFLSCGSTLLPAVFCKAPRLVEGSGLVRVFDSGDRFPASEDRPDSFGVRQRAQSSSKRVSIADGELACSNRTRQSILAHGMM